MTRVLVAVGIITRQSGVPAEKRGNSFPVSMLRKSRAFACTKREESRFSPLGSPHRKMSAGTAVLQYQILIAERPADKPYSGYWEFPGGKLDSAESAEQALHRELQEELGISVLSSKHLFNHTYDYVNNSVELSVWHVADFAGEPQGQERQALAWVDFSSMADYPLLPGNWAILDQIRSHLGP